MGLLACGGENGTQDDDTGAPQTGGGGQTTSTGMQEPSAGTPASEGPNADQGAEQTPPGSDPPAAAQPDGNEPAQQEPMSTAATPGQPAPADPMDGEGVAMPSEEPAAADPPAPEATGPCTIQINAEVSEVIPTVGIVTFSTDLGTVESARIDFGLDTTYGMTAPVDLAEPDYRTLLLGMKQVNDYHYRVVLEGGGVECASADMSITTGALPNVLPELDVENIAPEQLQGGFLMTGQYQARGGETSPAYIIDKDGDYVWAMMIGDYVTGVRMSYDGKYMWINGTDNTTAGVANIHRVSMDGLVDEDLGEQFGLQDHTITVLPDESVVFYGHDETECANIKIRHPDGTIEQLINSGEAHGAPGQCHVNHVEYSPFDDTLIFSDDLHNNYTKITRTGEVVWVLGGETSDFTGDGSQWSRQHGLDALSETRLLYFNNGEARDESGSVAYELELDLENMTATRVWTYQHDPPMHNQVLGDVQRMPNGNTVIAYSAQGIIDEVDADGNLLQEISWPLGGAFGYIHKRDTLYGPPPR